MQRSCRKRSVKPAWTLLLLAWQMFACGPPREYATFQDIPDSLFLSLHQREDGATVGTLKESMLLFGLPCLGGEQVYYSVVVDTTGRLVAMELSEAVDYQEIPCEKSISLYKNGEIRGTTLARDFRRGDTWWQGGSMIDFLPDGRILSGTLGADLNLPLHDLHLREGTVVTFYSNGVIEHIDVGQEGLTFRGQTYGNHDLYYCIDGSFCYLEEKHITNAGETYW